jgi:hypothetical protein
MNHYNLNTEELQKVISSSYCWNEVLTKLNMKTMTRSLERRIKDDNIDYSHISKHFDGLYTLFNKFSSDELSNILQTHTNWDDILKTLGYKPCYNINNIKQKLDKINIPYDHIKPSKNKITKVHKYDLEDILVKDSKYACMGTLLKRLKKERGWEHCCSICNLSVWNDKPIPLEIDHIDGCHTNNTYTNLRAICPNCHAQTDTYKGKNMKVCRENKAKRIENPSPPKIIKIKREPKYCACSKKINHRNTQCNQCKAKEVYESGKNRINERPSYEQLKLDSQQMSMVKVGKKYGVSDKTICKWIKLYEKYR